MLFEVLVVFYGFRRVIKGTLLAAVVGKPLRAPPMSALKECFAMSELFALQKGMFELFAFQSSNPLLVKSHPSTSRQLRHFHWVGP